MRGTAGLLLLIGVVLSGCKKNYTCECKNSNGSYIAGDVEATKSKATKHCEGLSTNSTTCYIK